MKRIIVPLLLVLMLAGCFQPKQEVSFNVRISPDHGHVPFTATITADPISTSYIFYLPNETIEQTSNTLEVTVDTLEWEATVQCQAEYRILRSTVTARGTNTRPQIYRPIINGDLWKWLLQPRERTLIDFNYRPGYMGEPAAGVYYQGDWHVTDIRFQAELKEDEDSIFYPPLEPGVCHAFWHGHVYENACILYPLYTGEVAANGLPYAPSTLDIGYPYDQVRSDRNIYYGQAFPSQEGTLAITVEDNFGRLTTKAFTIPVEPLHYVDLKTP